MGDRWVASPIIHKGKRTLALRHRTGQRSRPESPHSPWPIGPGRRRRDAHIVGYYAPDAKTGTEEGLGLRDGGERRNGEVSVKYW